MSIPYTPFSSEVRANPYPCYAALRAEAPVCFVPDIGAWAVARYEDVLFVLNHPELFSSDAMRTMFLSSKVGADPSQDPEAIRAHAGDRDGAAVHRRGDGPCS